jgi:hypothetical protein
MDEAQRLRRQRWRETAERLVGESREAMLLRIWLDEQEAQEACAGSSGRRALGNSATPSLNHSSSVDARPPNP